MPLWYWMNSNSVMFSPNITFIIFSSYYILNKSRMVIYSLILFPSDDTNIYIFSNSRCFSSGKYWSKPLTDIEVFALRYIHWNNWPSKLFKFNIFSFGMTYPTTALAWYSIPRVNNVAKHTPRGSGIDIYSVSITGSIKWSVECYSHFMVNHWPWYIHLYI